MPAGRLRYALRPAPGRPGGRARPDTRRVAPAPGPDGAAAHAVAGQEAARSIVTAEVLDAAGDPVPGRSAGPPTPPRAGVHEHRLCLQPVVRGQCLLRRRYSRTRCFSGVFLDEPRPRHPDVQLRAADIPPGVDADRRRRRQPVAGELGVPGRLHGLRDHLGLRPLVRRPVVLPPAQLRPAGRGPGPYSQVGAGFVLNDAYRDKSQKAIGAFFEFYLHAEVGVKYFISQNWSLDLEGGTPSHLEREHRGPELRRERRRGPDRVHLLLPVRWPVAIHDDRYRARLAAATDSRIESATLWPARSASGVSRRPPNGFPPPA